ICLAPGQGRGGRRDFGGLHGSPPGPRPRFVRRPQQRQAFPSQKNPGSSDRPGQNRQKDLKPIMGIKCPACAADNKDNAVHCKKCGASLVVMWSPTKEWHLKTLGIIYTGLIIVYFLLNWLLKPYLR